MSMTSATETSLEHRVLPGKTTDMAAIHSRMKSTQSKGKKATRVSLDRQKLGGYINPFCQYNVLQRINCREPLGQRAVPAHFDPCLFSTLVSVTAYFMQR